MVRVVGSSLPERHQFGVSPLLLRYIRAGAWARCGSSTEQCSPLTCFGSQEERRFAISAYGMKIAGDGT